MYDSIQFALVRDLKTQRSTLKKDLAAGISFTTLSLIIGLMVILCFKIGPFEVKAAMTGLLGLTFVIGALAIRSAYKSMKQIDVLLRSKR